MIAVAVLGLLALAKAEASSICSQEHRREINTSVDNMHWLGGLHASACRLVHLSHLCLTEQT